MKYPFLVLSLALAVGCSDSSSESSGGNGGSAGSSGAGGAAGAAGAAGMGGGAGTGGSTPEFSPNPPLEIGPSDRPSEVTIPSDYDPDVTYPLVMVLHGAGANGPVQAGYFNLIELADTKEFVVVYPNGVQREGGGGRIWNGAGCCGASDVDDVGYISDLVDEALETYNTDPDRVYLVGHSNGGFLSFRLVCEMGEKFAAMMSLAGSTWPDESDCQPGTSAVSVLVVHGTVDGTVSYDGTVWPGAVEVAERSAATAGCDPSMTMSLGTADYLEAVDGEETDKIAYLGCDEGLEVELWTLNEGVHIPFLGTEFPDDMIDWLFEKSR